MTCIVGIVDSKGVHMGADSAVGNSKSASMRLDKNPKIFRLGGMLIGGAGLSRMNDVIEYCFTPPEHPESMDVMMYIAGPFATALKKAFKENGVSPKNDDGIEKLSGTLLIGYKGRLFSMDSTFAIGENNTPYEAVGSGARVALGALYAMTAILPGVLIPVDGRLKIALEAAAAMSVDVSGPFNYITLENPPTP